MTCSLERLSNSALWRQWKAAIHDQMDTPSHRSIDLRVNALEDEIIRRIKEAGRQNAPECKF